MMHRSECDGSAFCRRLGCECHCHDRCGVALTRLGEPCYRLVGHANDHRSRYAVINNRLAKARAR